MTTARKRIGAVLIVTGMMIMFCLSCMCTVASAKTKGTLTLICECENQPVKGIDWSLYRIGSYDGEKIILEGEFANLPVDMRDLSASGLADAASTLDGYACVYKYKTTSTANSKKDGTVQLKFDEAGAYLIVGSYVVDGNTRYYPTPAIFILDPEKETETTIYPKIKKDDIVDGGINEYHLMKIWNNEDDENAVYTEIIVDIYRDSKYYKTVTLSKENNWSYFWESNEHHKWTMIERKIPKEYAVIYRENGKQYIVVNVYVPDFDFDWELNFPPPVAEEQTTTTTTDVTTTDGTTAETTTTATETTTTTEDIAAQASKTTTQTTQKVTTKKTTTTSKLPQTGQLWWPVPVMAIGGLVLVATGARIISGSKRDEDE